MAREDHGYDLKIGGAVTDTSYWARVQRARISRRAMVRTTALGGLGLAGLAAGCGGGESEPAKTGTSAVSAQPRRGGVLSIPGASPPGFDPIRSSDARTMGVMSMVGSSLWKNRSGPNLSAWDWQLDPDMALSLEQPDSTTYVYKLRTGVTWQNKPPVNGREFTAEDVRYTFDAYKTTKGSPTGTEMVAMDRVEAVDPHTVRVKLTAPTADFNTKLGGWWVWMMPKEIADADGDFRKRAIGTGPFTLEKFTENVGAEYARNPSYYESGKPRLDGIKSSFVSDASRQLAGFLSGEFHIWTGITDEAVVQQLTSRLSNLQVFRSNRGNQYAVLRSDKPPFNDARVRQAFALTLDYSALVKAFGGSEGKVEALLPQSWTQWTLPRDQWGEGAKFRSKPDIQQAKQLLSAAGYPNGIDTDISTNSNYMTAIQGRIMPAIQEMARAAGIRLNINSLDPAVYARVLPGLSDWNGVLIFGLGRWADPDWIIGVWMRTEGGRYAGHFNDARLDGFIDAERRELNVEKRRAIFWDIEKYNLVQNYMIALFSDTTTDVLVPAVADYSTRPEVAPRWYETIWLKA